VRVALHIAVTLSLCTFALTCDKATEPPPPGEQPVHFEAADASCTEVWLSVKFHIDAQPRTFEIRRVTAPADTLLIFSTTAPPVRLDTLIVDEGLLPNRHYTYTLTRPGVWQSQPLTATITTMDSTDHNAWQFSEPVLLGDGSSSTLYDVCILSDTLAYAVGAVYKLDSLGNWDPLPYNLVKWDGQQCELKRVTVMYRGSPITPPLNAIFAFSPTDIWLSSGVPIRGDGQNWTQYHLFDMGILSQNDGSINKIWGSSAELWFVGNRGTIVHRSPTGTWRRVESGVGLSVYDIFGSRRRVSEESELFAVAAQQFVSFEKRILRITPADVSTVSDSGIPYSIHGIWFRGGGPYYVVGSGMYRKLDVVAEGPWQPLHPGITPYYIYAIGGNAVNDILACGSFGELLHFNGMSWRSYRNTPGFSSLELYEISCRDNLVIAVGYDQPRAAVVVGRRP
jgi:hypothetical protein